MRFINLLLSSPGGYVACPESHSEVVWGAGETGLDDSLWGVGRKGMGVGLSCALQDAQQHAWPLLHPPYAPGRYWQVLDI